MFATLGHDSITLHYQPIARNGGEVAGMEALMRWHHQQRGPISPEAFIPIFEQSGLIVPISRWALGQACEDAVSWAPPLQVAVNLSAIQFDKENLLDLVRSVLEQSGLEPCRLELEVTAASLVGNPARAAAIMEDLRSDGVAIALAGFTGDAAALARLREFSFSKVKIARELVARLEDTVSAPSVVRMIIELAHSRGIEVSAEGVETKAQLALLEAEGCDWLQGYLIGRPAPIESLAALTGRIASDAAPAEAPPLPAGFRHNPFRPASPALAGEAS